MSDEELLTSVQEATFRYFWDWGHPASGLARERNTSGDICTTGGTGFGIMAIVVGAERGFITRHEAAERVLRIVTFLEGKAERYHGAWSHWLNGRTGKTIPFASKNGVKADDGGDLVETSFLMQGMLTARQYFEGDEPVEKEIRERVTRLWREVEWNWYLREPKGRTLYWHWSPRYGWMMDHQIRGFNECMITYLLAIASPTHPIPPSWACRITQTARPTMATSNGWDHRWAARFSSRTIRSWVSIRAASAIGFATISRTTATSRGSTAPIA